MNDQPIDGAYVGCSFHYNNELMTVSEVNNNIAVCHFLNDSDDESDDRQPLHLPIDLVHQLVASFGY